MDINALKPGIKLETIRPFDLSVDDEVWGVPIGTEFTFKETFTCPTNYHHMHKHMLRIVDSEDVEHVIAAALFNDCMAFVHPKNMSGYYECIHCSKETWIEELDDMVIQAHIDENPHTETKILNKEINTINLGYDTCDACEE